jgi:hypothetical protein
LSRWSKTAPARIWRRYLSKPCPWWQPGEVGEIFRIALDRVRIAEIRA